MGRIRRSSLMTLIQTYLSYRSLLLLVLLMISGNYYVECTLTFMGCPNNDTKCQITINEEQLSGYLIYTFKFEDTAVSKLSFQIKYRNNNQNPTNLVSLVSRDKETDLVVSSRIDKETFMGSLILQIEVTGSETQTFPASSFVIFIQDIDDNYPFFHNNSLECSMAENQITETCGPMVVRDLDTVNSIISIEIKSSSKGSTSDFVILNVVVALLEVGYQRSFEIGLKSPLDFEAYQLIQLQIEAKDSANHIAITNFNIRVIDRPDQPPVFQNLPYSVTIKENLPENERVLTVVAIDGDSGIKDTIIYSFNDDNQFNQYFNINSTTGDVTLNKSLDRENDEIFKLFGLLKLDVVATENSTVNGTVVSAATTIRIQVEDINDSPAEFEKSLYQGSINENSVTDMAVTFSQEIRVTDKDIDKNGEFNLTLLQNGIISKTFKVSPSTGRNELIPSIKVQNGTELDYEAVKFINLTLIATQITPVFGIPIQSQTIVVISINDINDNSPQFAKSTYNFSVTENAPRNTSVGIVKATDLDSGIYGTVAYRLHDPNNKFTISQQSGLIIVNVDGDKDLSLLDKEKLDRYFVTVEARDGGGMINLANVEISLVDVNDNKPVFEKKLYEVRAKENSLLFATNSGTFEIKASDSDISEEYKNVKYTLQNGSDDTLTLSLHLAINPSTGIINITKPFDREAITNGFFDVTVKAIDNNKSELFDTSIIRIFIEDVNDNPPYFSNFQYFGAVPQNVSSLTTILIVNATDLDQPNTAQSDITFRLIGQDSGPFTLFTSGVPPGQAIIRRDSSIRLQVKLYNFSIEAIDRGYPSQSSLLSSIAINITEINDEAPSFIQNEFKFNINENSPTNHVIGHLKATDPDTNPQLTFSLGDFSLIRAWNSVGGSVESSYDFKSIIRIEAGNGTIYVNGSLDREQAIRIQIPVIVIDLAAQTPTPSQTASASIILEIQDLNDNPPEFSSHIFTLTISEGFTPKSSTSSGSTDLYVVAKDKDTVGVLRYNVSDITGLFDIRSESGQIILLKNLDRENMSKINFTVSCSDGIHLIHTSVLVTVLDVNDNEPQFVGNSLGILKYTINEDMQTGSVIGRLEAEDKDEGENGRVIFSIKSPVNSKFYLSPEGNLTLAQSLLSSSEATYKLTIEIRDNPPNSNPLKNTKEVTIIVQDLNNNYPTFPKSLYEYTLKENINIGTKIDEILATDKDSGNNSLITYNLELPSTDAIPDALTLFKVEKRAPDGTALITLMASLHNRAGRIVIVLKASDHGIPVKSNKCTLIITVEDVNEHAPNFTNPIPSINGGVSKLSVLENSLTTISNVTAYDNDAGINGQIRFFIESQNSDHDSFRIDSLTGSLSNVQMFDRETKDSYKFRIKATDLGIPQLSSFLDVEVDILDINDNDPMFPVADRNMSLSIEEGPQSTITIPNSLPILTGYKIGNVSRAFDIDLGNNSKICYLLINNVSNIYLDKDTGDLFGLNEFDRESQEYIVFHISAVHFTLCSPGQYFINILYNQSSPSHAKVNLTILDINDNPPVFNKVKILGGILKTSNPGILIINYMTMVSDKDLVSKDKLRFYLIGPLRFSSPLDVQLKELTMTNILVINSTTGMLSTGPNVYFTESMQGYIELEVGVSDGKFNSSVSSKMYLVSLNQQAIVIIRGYPGTVAQMSKELMDYFSQQLQVTVNQDFIKPYVYSNGTTLNDLTSIYIHAVKDETNYVLTGAELVRKFDERAGQMLTIYTKYKIVDVVEATKLISTSAEANYATLANTYRLVLIVACCLFILLIIIIIIFAILCRTKYKQKLKAFTTTSSDFTGTFKSNTLPGTNQYEIETNPFSRKSGMMFSSDHGVGEDPPQNYSINISPETQKLESIKKFGVPMFGIQNDGLSLSKVEDNVRTRTTSNDMETDIISSSETVF